MGRTLAALWIILVELWPLLVLAAVVSVVLWRQAQPALRARAAWEGERRALEAELERASHATGGIDGLVEVQGRLAAHDVLKPTLPRWLFWKR